MTTEDRRQIRPLPPPWDRIFPLASRLFVWGLLFSSLYILRSFFLQIFLTFVFSYILAHGVDALRGRIPNRPVRVIAVFLVFLGALGAIGVLLAPKIKDQAEVFAANYPKYFHQADQELRKLGDAIPALKPRLQEVSSQQVFLQVLGLGEKAEGKEREVQTLELLRNVGTRLFGFGTGFLLSLLFSFLIVLDLPRLTRGVQNLAHTKLAFIYEEAAESIHSFGKVLGRAMEAQLMIAMVNTVLTAIGIYVIGLQENLIFFSAIVFFCSFIPVAGVFISSAPICLVALEKEGFGLMLWAIALILLIHFIETYFLNPHIFGHHLRINPVLVLIILTIGGSLFHVWGLILGVPIMTYIFGHAIRRKVSEAPAEAV